MVHGKRSLLSKMPGDEWQQFANLRLLFFYLWTHPGKKILFMGGEFGQLSEWYCKVSLDWHLVEERPMHQKLQHFVKTMNHFYREHKALWEDDHTYNGFQWLDFKDVNSSIIAFARKAKDPQDHLICLLNFTPQVHHDYKLGVLSDCPYRQIFSSDSAQFGGSGIEERVRSGCRSTNPLARRPCISPSRCPSGRGDIQTGAWLRWQVQRALPPPGREFARPSNG